MNLEELFHADPGSQIMMGSVGWEDTDEYYFLGDGDNDGHTLVRVQLFEGRDITKPINPARAQGHKIICMLSSLNGLRIPPKDSRVFIACERGKEHVPGAGVIFAAVEKTPSRAGNIKPDETVIVGPDGSEGRVVIKKDGSVTMMTSAGNTKGGKSVVLSVTPDGFKFGCAYGSIVLDATGFHVKTKAGPRIDMGAVNIPGLPSEIAGAVTGYCKISAPVIRNHAGIVYLGAGPTYNDVCGAPAAAYTTPAPVTSGPTFQSASVKFSIP